MVIEASEQNVIRLRDSIACATCPDADISALARKMMMAVLGSLSTS